MGIYCFETITIYYLKNNSFEKFEFFWVTNSKNSMKNLKIIKNKPEKY